MTRGWLSILAAVGFVAWPCCATPGARVAPDLPAIAYRVTVSDGIPGQGYCDLLEHELAFNTRIFKETDLARTVVAHEIGHALGCDHIEASGTVMYVAHGYGDGSLALTPAEVAQVLPVVVVVRLPAGCSPVMSEAAWWSREQWNRATGREAVRVEPGS